jgi:hypothetical protein
MAKTKRRSCKGGRKSRRCRGGVSYFNRTFKERQKYHDPARFSEPQQYPSRFGDTKQEDPMQTIPEMSVPEMLHRQYGYLRDKFDDATKPLRRKFSAARASTASAVRGLRDSVSSLPSALRNSRIGATAFNAIGLRSGYLDRSKLVPVNKTIQENYGLRENAADKVYAIDESGKLHEAALESLTPEGYLPDRSNPRKATFLPGRGPKPGQSWYITPRRR